MNLMDYTLKYAVRGACTCGRCFDAPEAPEKDQPTGHTVDLTFFKVSAKEGASKEEFLKLVQEQHPHWLDGREHNFIDLGGELGDQGYALMVIGLGGVLGVWQALSPDILIPQISKDDKLQMAGMGMVTLLYVAKGGDRA